MADMIDMQRDLGIDPRSLSSLASKLHVLRFYLDKKKENVVSSIDGVIVFVSPRYYGDPPAIGDVYICNVQSKGTVYWAEPLVKVNTAMLIGLDDRIKDEMFDYLWQTNRKEFETIFEERYRKSAMEAANKQLEEQYRQSTEDLRRRIEELEAELKRSRLLLQNRAPRESDEAEPPSDGSEPSENRPPSHQLEMQMQEFQDLIRRSLAQPLATKVAGPAPVHAERTGPNLIRSESFTEDRYDVHMSPNRKYLLVEPDEQGEVVCVNRTLFLGNLESLSPYNGPMELLARRSDKYGGMLIEL